MKTKSSARKQVTTMRKPVSKKTLRKNSEKLAEEEMKVWQNQFVVAEHWQSDLSFFSDELRFLQRLLDKYFVWISDDKIMDRAKKIAGKLILIMKRRMNCEERVMSHLHHISALVENPFPHDATKCNQEHAELEPLIADLTNDFRSIKKEVFQLAEILETEQAKPLLEA